MGEIKRGAVPEARNNNGEGENQEEGTEIRSKEVKGERGEMKE